MGIWDIYEWNLLFLPICPGKRWQHPPWWTYHPPVHDRAPAALAPRTSANLVVLPLVTWSPSLAVAVPTECEFHPKKMMAGSWWCDFSKWSWDWSWFCLLMSCPTRPKIPEFGEKDENPAGKKKTISGGWTRWTWLNLHFHHFSVLLAYLDSKGKIYLEKKKTYQILPAEHPH